MKHKKEEIKAGLIVLSALMIFGAMVVFIGGSGFWKKLDVYHIHFSGVGGLEKGAAVRLGGLRVGQVLDIAVAPDDVSKLDVTIGVEPETPITYDAVASVRTLGLVGDYYVLLSQRSGADRPLPPGVIIPSQEMMEIADLLVQAAELSQTINGSVEKVVTALNQLLSEENIGYVRASLQAFSRLTAEGERSLSATARDLSVVLKSLHIMVANLDGLVGENRNHIQGTILAIKQTAEELEALSRTVNQTLIENQDDLNSLIASVHEDSLKAGQLMDHLDGRVTVTGEYLEETMANLTEISENLKLLSSQLRRQPWRLVYRARTKK